MEEALNLLNTSYFYLCVNLSRDELAFEESASFNKLRAVEANFDQTFITCFFLLKFAKVGTVSFRANIFLATLIREINRSKLIINAIRMEVSALLATILIK